MTEAVAVFGLIAGTVGLLNTTASRLTELVTQVRAYKQLHVGLNQGIEATLRAIEFLERIGGDERVKSIVADTFVRANEDLVRINGKLWEIVSRRGPARFGWVRFLAANTLLDELKTTLARIEPLHKHLEVCHIVAKSTSQTVDGVLDLTNVVAKEETVKEISTRQLEMHDLLLQISQRPEQGITLQNVALDARDFPFRIGLTLKRLAELPLEESALDWLLFNSLKDRFDEYVQFMVRMRTCWIDEDDVKNELDVALLTAKNWIQAHNLDKPGGEERRLSYSYGKSQCTFSSEWYYDCDSGVLVMETSLNFCIELPSHLCRIVELS